MSVDNEAALDLGCKLCAWVFLAVSRRDGLSWLEKIIRDAKIRQRGFEDVLFVQKG